MEEIFALKNSFIEEIRLEYKNFTDKNIRDFLIYLNEEYPHENISGKDVPGSKLKDKLADGSTNIYINPEVSFHMNTKKSYPDKKSWDREFSELLFMGIKNNIGLFKINDDQDEVHLGMDDISDIRIWWYLAIFKLHKYSINRWGDQTDISGRLLTTSLSNGSAAKNAILRLYLGAKLTYDQEKNKLINHEIIWYSQDVWVAIAERSQANMKMHLKWLLEFLSLNKDILTKESDENYYAYRKFMKLYNAYNKITVVSHLNKDDFLVKLEDFKAECNIKQ
jgi:hypothetical protein